MSIPEESSTQQPTDAAAHLPSQQRRSSYLSSGGDWTDDTPVAVEPPSGTSTTSTNIGMTSSLPPPLAVTVPIEFEGMDVDIPLNDLSEDDDDDAADEAAGYASQSSVGSLSLDDHLAVVASAAEHVANDKEASTTSAGSPSATRGRRPSFQTHRRPSQRRRSSATSFEMHDSLIFEELNKLVEDDTDSDEDEDDDDGDPKDDRAGKKIPASPSSTIHDAAANQQEEVSLNDVFANNNNNNNNNNNGHRAGRRGSSRSLASVIEDMELDEDDINDIGDNDDNSKAGTKTDNSKAGTKMPIVMQFEQRILDRLEHQEDKRALVRTRSEASLHSVSSAGGSRRGSGNHALRGSRAVQSERVLTGRAREVWPEIHMEATSGEDQVGNDDDKKKNTGKSGKDAASNKFSIKSWFRGLGRKNN